MASVVIQRTLLLYLTVSCLISGCTDYKFGQLDLLPKANIKTALDNLTVLIPHRYKERITRRYTDGSPAIIRTYDIMYNDCLLYTSPSPRDGLLARMPSSA